MVAAHKIVEAASKSTGVDLTRLLYVALDSRSTLAVRGSSSPKRHTFTHKRRCVVSTAEETHRRAGFAWAARIVGLSRIHARRDWYCTLTLQIMDDATDPERPSKTNRGAARAILISIGSACPPTVTKYHQWRSVTLAGGLSTIGLIWWAGSGRGICLEVNDALHIFVGGEACPEGCYLVD